MFESIYRHPKSCAPHISLICHHLERVFTGQSTRLIINMPPRAGKTQLCVEHFLPWAMGNFPDSEFLHVSYSKTLAAKNTYNARNLMSSEIYQTIFPHLKIKTDSHAKDDFRTNYEGIAYADGAQGTIVGYGAGKLRDYFGGAILIDDPHKVDEANSRVMLEHVWTNFLDSIRTRVNSDTTPIVIIGHRVNARDLCGRLLAGENGEKWELLKIPALDENDHSFWPERFPEEMLFQMRAFNPRGFAALYQQEPLIVGGNLIKTQDFRRYSVVPKLKYRTIYADTAQKTKEHNDYSVLECWGYGEDNNLYLLDLIRGKWEAPELKRKALDFWNKHKADHAKGELRHLKIEDAASGTGLIQDLKKSHAIPIMGIIRIKDKYTRLLDILGYIEAGYVYLPDNAPFVNDFLTECEAFSADDTHPHDDQVDPMMDAITDMMAHNNLTKVWEKFL
jgi:predicted phage terminase large subunit-like protein